MGIIKSALKAGIVVKVVDVVRREAAKPENQAKIRDLLDRAKNEASKPENQRKAKEMLNKFGNRPGKNNRMP